eukprot:CAMPEP_0173398378 /NCGR_PEP_ID=MMETSP1356-20130122/41412_1 /TAXON_ID=77927 ORGANISM="Hemiselmis virescens, Strain PCC157" /NCGR_SAMPLE_ID=MMETSP1356 /ASSEMBLY_ACC=CAM_ASM_000847 /LENGTH=49 /DNA_ID= /DNA_START= /DNA_END= /DNA_ORIENTATION=
MSQLPVEGEYLSTGSPAPVPAPHGSPSAQAFLASCALDSRCCACAAEAA